MLAYKQMGRGYLQHDIWFAKHYSVKRLTNWWDGSLVGPTIRVNAQVKSIFIVLKRKECSLVPKDSGQYYQRRIPFKMTRRVLMNIKGQLN